MSQPSSPAESPLLTPRSPTHSLTETTEYVLPQHANALGNVFGGQIMAWVDLCAAIAAQRHAGRLCVTAMVDDLRFQGPVQVGEVVHLQARVTATFRTSLEVQVVVTGENPRTRERWPCVEAWTTFVCVDDHQRPSPVPPLDLSDPQTAASQAAGAERRKARLQRSGRAV